MRRKNVIRETLGRIVYGEEDDEVEDAAAAALLAASKTLATVEAGTAGRVASLFAQAAARRDRVGQSFFHGGLVLPGFICGKKIHLLQQQKMLPEVIMHQSGWPWGQ